MSTKFSNGTKRALVLLAATAVVAAACGSDNKASNASTAATQPAVTTPAATTPAATTPAATEPAATQPAATAPGTTAASGAGAASLDTNHDGKVVFGIAAAGPADDGAYYQAVVDAAKQLSKDNGFADPIVVDNIQAADAATVIGASVEVGVVRAGENCAGKRALTGCSAAARRAALCTI